MRQRLLAEPAAASSPGIPPIMKMTRARPKNHRGKSSSYGTNPVCAASHL